MLAGCGSSESATLGRARRAAVRGGSALAEAAAESLGHRVDGRRHRRFARPRLDHPHALVVERSRGESRRAHAGRRMLHAGAARARVRCATATSSARGAGPATATTGRRRITASPSTRWTTSGSAATAPTTRTFSSSRATGSSCCRWASRAATPAAATRRTSAAPRRCRSTLPRTRPSSPTAISNRRVAVLDMSSGAMKRYWGAYGNPPDDTDLGAYDPDAPPAPQFRNPCTVPSPRLDGLVYVCDRVNDRIQVFRKDGTFVSELRVAPQTRGGGSVWDIAFSRDPAQTYIFLADGGNERVWIIERETLADSDELRRRRTATRAVLRRAQHRDGFAAATSTRPRRSKVSASRSSSTSAWHRSNPPTAASCGRRRAAIDRQLDRDRYETSRTRLHRAWYTRCAARTTTPKTCNENNNSRSQRSPWRCRATLSGRRRTLTGNPTRTRARPPSVDQQLTDPVLVGAIDLHAHFGPDSYPRQWDAFEVVALAQARGLRAIVLKNHCRGDRRPRLPRSQVRRARHRGLRRRHARYADGRREPAGRSLHGRRHGRLGPHRVDADARLRARGHLQQGAAALRRASRATARCCPRFSRSST